MQNQKRLITLILLLAVNIFYCQKKEYTYKELSTLFNSYSENDERAMVYVNLYIDKARKEQNLKKLIAGYEEAIYFTGKPEKKLQLGDSIIIIAKKSGNSDQISRAYLGKGIIYYYNIRNFRKALEEYLKAFQYSKNSDDAYLKNKIVYHLGIVKSYLGYYEEAAAHFKQTAFYFEEIMNQKDIHEIIRQNNESGYLNSIYRLSKCYYDLEMHSKEDSLINIGLQRIGENNLQTIEYAYFLKAKGRQMIRNGDIENAFKSLRSAEDILKHNQDYASLATVNYYLGKLYWNTGNKDRSVFYFKKIDSLVRKFNFITPETRSSYEYLINYAKNQNNDNMLLYYSHQLVKADSVMISDFPKLSSKIRNEYDSDHFAGEKKILVKDKKIISIVYFLSIAVGGLLLIYLYFDHRRKEKELTVQYNLLLERFELGNQDSKFKDIVTYDQKTPQIVVREPNETYVGKEQYSAEIIEEIKTKLKIFVDKKQFLNKNLKLPDVAILLGTNRTTLSYILNDHMNVSFPDYIKLLRINYITNLMLTDKKYLNYKIESLAEMCGMSNRQVFRVHFRQINGMNPTDFIRKRFEELNQPKV